MSKFLGKVYRSIRPRFSWPRRGIIFQDYLGVYSQTSRAWVAVILTVLLLIAWMGMYYIETQMIGAMRLNSSLLQQDIIDGIAKPVSAVALDGSLTLQNGATYSEGSITETVLVYHSFGNPYYISGHSVLAVPVDFLSYVKSNFQTVLYFVLTVLVYFAEKFYLTRYNTGKYYEIIRDSYPVWLRFIRWAIVGIAFATMVFWVYPFI